MADTLLDVINEQDEVIGRALRSEIHAKGLLHREISIWFITADRQIVFQRRSMTKQTNPGILATAVAGHVESGSNYLDTAIIEAKEETGLSIHPNDLACFARFLYESHHPDTNLYNRTYRMVYGYVFTGHIHDLVIEQEDGDGFVLMPLDEVANPSEAFLRQSSVRLIQQEFPRIRAQLESLIA